jgi:hypothetical protein
MTTFVFDNNINTTLSSAVNSTQTTITLSSAANLPASIPAGDYLAITLRDAATKQISEIVYATVVTGSTLTVVRAQEGTTALTWAIGDLVYSGPTAGQMESFALNGFANPMTTEGDLIVGGTAGAPSRLAAGSTPGYVLTTNGPSTLPSWNAPSSTPVVTSFNTRTGAVTLTYSDVTGALGYVPYSTAGGTISGNVAITGTASVGSTLQVAGSIVANQNIALGPWSISNSTGTLVFTSTTGAIVVISPTGALSTSGTIQGGSDARVKTNVQPIRDALETLRMYLRGVEYDRTDTGQHEAGFIAQEVTKGLPHLVSQAKMNGFDDFHVLDYMHITAYLAAAILELAERIEP